jgi:hypothetical protein
MFAGGSPVKRSLVFALVLCFGLSFGLAAQQAGTSTQQSNTAKDSELYVKILYIDRIYPHQDGYKIEYRTSKGAIATTYIPLTWFAGTAGKGVLVADTSKSSPFMEINFKDGKFAYIKLHVFPNFGHDSWGTILASEGDIRDKFKIDSLNVVY